MYFSSFKFLNVCYISIARYVLRINIFRIKKFHVTLIQYDMLSQFY